MIGFQMTPLLTTRTTRMHFDLETYLKDWTPVTKQDLELHLATCPDYERTNYVQGSFYRYRGTRKQFAFEDTKGNVWGAPDPKPDHEGEP